MAKKTDNHDPRAKLDLRRYFLDKYHSGKPPVVFDACQGGGVLWRRLKQEYELAGYWGVDQKPKPGRLKIDSVRVLDQPGWKFDVVDIDTYGLPWKHWLAVRRHATEPLTVFLTVGITSTGPGAPASKAELAALGLDKLGLPIPPAFVLRFLRRMAISPLLTMGCENGIMPVEIVEALSRGNARYFGVRLEPKENGPQAPTCGPAHKPS